MSRPAFSVDDLARLDRIAQHREHCAWLAVGAALLSSGCATKEAAPIRPVFRPTYTIECPAGKVLVNDSCLGPREGYFPAGKSKA